MQRLNVQVQKVASSVNDSLQVVGGDSSLGLVADQGIAAIKLQRIAGGIHVQDK